MPIEPYYSEGGITIFCGDCREILPTLGRFDLLLTDPPWGVKNNNANAARKRGYSKYDPSQPSIDWEPCYGDDAPFDPSDFMVFKKAILWDANHYASRLPDSSFWLCWDRKVEKAANSTATDCELAWVRGKSYKTTRVFRHMWSGFQRDSQVGEKHKHPMEKPVALMRWCIKWFPDAKTILDPFAGSCTTGVAAKLEGRQATLIEINERYCEIGANRLRQNVLDFGE